MQVVLSLSGKFEDWVW